MIKKLKVSQFFVGRNPVNPGLDMNSIISVIDGNKHKSLRNSDMTDIIEMPLHCIKRERKKNMF